MIVVKKCKVYAHTSVRVQSVRLKLECKLAGWSGYSACLILIPFHLPAAALGMHLETAGDDFDLSSFLFLFI